MRTYIAALILPVILAGPVAAQEGTVNLTLKEAVRQAIERNLDVKAELYNPASFEADIRKYRGIYDTTLTLSTTYQDSTTLPASTFVSGGSATNEQQVFKINPGANQLLPTGGTVGLTFNNTYDHNNASTSGFMTSYWQSDVTLSLSQPLLQNFGRETTELNISISQYGKEGALEQFKSKLLDIISQVRTQYFQLHSLRENLEVKKTALSLAEKILNDTQAQVKAGVLPAMEILNAQFSVATRQKDLIDAERTLKDQSDALRLLLQMPGKDDIIPVDPLASDKYPVDETAEIQRAISSRPDLQQLRSTVKSNDLQARVARNQTLPSLNLTSSVAFTGLAPTYSRDIDRVASTDYPVWGAGLQFSYPLGNNAAENTYIKSKLKLEQSRTQEKSLEESVTNDVKTAVRAIQSSYKQLEVTERGKSYAEEVLQAYIKKQKVGLATSKDVMDSLNNLVTAKGNRIQALSDYNNAINQLWKATGELLDREGISVSQKDADALYGQFR